MFQENKLKNHVLTCSWRIAQFEKNKLRPVLGPRQHFLDNNLLLFPLKMIFRLCSLHSKIMNRTKTFQLNSNKISEECFFPKNVF